jgi:hypothetical protein
LDGNPERDEKQQGKIDIDKSYFGGEHKRKRGQSNLHDMPVSELL